MIRLLYFRDTDRVCGPGKTIVNTCRTIDPERFSIVVTSPEDPGRANPFLEYARDAGVEVLPLRMGRYFDVSAAMRLSQLLREHRVDILQTHDAQTRRIGIPAASLAGVVHVASVHGWIENNWTERGNVLLDKTLLRLSSKIIVMSEPMKRELLRWRIPESKLLVLHNSILLEDYRSEEGSPRFRETFQISADEQVVGLVGRISPEKGYSVFLNMADRIRRVRRRVRFLVVGDGSGMDDLRARIDALGLRDSVVMAGYHADMRKVYAALDVLVISSFTEGLPNVLLEAFAYSKPVVATSVGAIPDVLTHGDEGYLVPAGDDAMLARHVLNLLDDERLAGEMGRRGRRTIEERFDIRARTARLEHLYSGLMNHSSSRR